MSEGNQIRDYIHINKLCSKVYKVIKKKKNLGIINICSGKPKKLFRLLNHGTLIIKLIVYRGYFKYPEYEGLNFWGSNVKIK